MGRGSCREKQEKIGDRKTERDRIYGLSEREGARDTEGKEAIHRARPTEKETIQETERESDQKPDRQGVREGNK